MMITAAGAGWQQPFASVARPFRDSTVNSIYTLNPLVDQRWNEFAAHHAGGSVFHQHGWLEALSRTYGYEPLVLTSSPPSRPLEDGVVLCRVSSWITGTRLVSLPFSDHCDPLLDHASNYGEFINWLRAECEKQRYRYVELRPLCGPQELGDLKPADSYYFHELDIRPTLEQIFRGFQKDSIQRKIRRAEREHLFYEAGHSEQLVGEFFRLLMITRKRHRLPPQPRAWFTNLLQCMGESIQIRVARVNTRAVAALLTLRHRETVVYKYGCSDEHFHSLGAMPFLFWRLIEDSKASKAEKIDFGRSDLHNHGLNTFKDRFGAKRKLLTYYRYPWTEKAQRATERSSSVQRVVSLLPDAVMSLAGRVMYRHIG